MCGIAGFIEITSDDHIASSRLNAMLKPIHHRGPDDCGTWCDGQYGIALGHRRLAILDRSPAGHQPMESTCGRFIIVFNGEIYNHLDLRRNLEKSGLVPPKGWHSRSDTETLLGCIAAWGAAEALKSTVGMFALALWDKREKTLTLARDRIGEKPLYYGWQNGAFFFGSELKSLRAHPSFIGELDWEAASLFLRLNYIPAPSTIYRGIYKLLPGTLLRMTEANIVHRSLSKPAPYWSLAEMALQGLDQSFKGSFNDAVNELEFLIQRAVRLQSIADVPVGAFLSGGIDSSLIVAMMRSATTSKVTTFSIGMPEVQMDESRHASAVARYLGTTHIEHTIAPREALDLIPRLSEIWDEPFADSSQIPTFLVSRLAKQHVTVALSGDGGDELFLGYERYRLLQQIWRSRCLGLLPWDTIFSMLSPLRGIKYGKEFLRRGVAVANAWRQPDAAALSCNWTDRYRQDRFPLKRHKDGLRVNSPTFGDAARTCALWDTGSYLPDDILVKVDRASMANSLETRAPLLDHRIIEFALSLPPQFKMGKGIQKRVLKEVLYRQIPQALVDRKKMGFSIPMASWLRHELRPWAESILDAIPDDSDCFEKATVTKLWRDHNSGIRDNTEQLWGIISLVAFTIKNKN
jgi:asparagine synthase (glutamine-hydrolysing)